MIEITVPVLSESITEDMLTAWCKQEGEHARRDDVIAELETDKVILETPTPRDDALSNIIASEGSTVTLTQPSAYLRPQTVIEKTVIPVTETLTMPSARLKVQCNDIELANVVGSGRSGCILKEDAWRITPIPVIQPERVAGIVPVKPLTPGVRQERREPISRLCQRIAERLLASQQNNVILTTSNEVNMQSVIDLRTHWRGRFAGKHGVKLGFMSSFVKAVTQTLECFPVVNANVDDSEITWRDYCDIGIAVSSNRGLVVPALRNAQSLSLVEIERRIAEYVTQARNDKLPLEALQSGTFSITNGSTFGSVMSTPIISPLQSAILGIYAIMPRPVAENGQVAIRPMMYLALSYDYRIIDSQGVVQILVTIRELLESPEQPLLDL